MLGTFLVSVAALLVAIVGCAWLKPVGLRQDQPLEPTPVDPDDAFSRSAEPPAV